MKRYTIELDDEEGTDKVFIKRDNDGFSAFELLGILDITIKEIRESFSKPERRGEVNDTTKPEPK